MKFSILGGGSWGTALAIHLAKNGNSVRVWEFMAEQAKAMQETRICPLLPQARIPDSVLVSSDMSQILLGSEAIVIVVPSDKVEATLEKAAPLIQNQPIILCSKGFAAEGRLLSEVVQRKVKGQIYCLYGPTHAEEVGKGMFSGIVLAGGKGKAKLKKAIESPVLRVDTSNDIIGVQVAAALKNILAVGVGILDGSSLGDNAKAYMITKGLHEITNVGIAMGGKKETFYGLAGIGDILVTCGSKHSRNFHVGQEVGKGRSLQEVLAEMKMVAEGVTTTQFVPQLEKKQGVKIPLLRGIFDVLYNGKKMEDVLREVTYRK